MPLHIFAWSLPFCLTAANTSAYRVHTMALPVVQELSELYRSADAGATACLLGKLGVEKAGQSKLDDTRKALEMKVCLR